MISNAIFKADIKYWCNFHFRRPWYNSWACEQPMLGWGMEGHMLTSLCLQKWWIKLLWTSLIFASWLSFFVLWHLYFYYDAANDDDDDDGDDDNGCSVHTMTVSLHSVSANSPQFVKEWWGAHKWSFGNGNEHDECDEGNDDYWYWYLWQRLSHFLLPNKQ